MHLPIRAKLSLHKQISKSFKASIRYYYNEIYNNTSVSLAYQSSDLFNFKTSYNLNTQAIGLKAQYSKYYIELVTDNFNLTYANSLSLFAGMEIRL